MPAKKKKAPVTKKTSSAKTASPVKKSIVAKESVLLEEKQFAPIHSTPITTPIKSPTFALPRSERIQTAEGWRRSLVKKMTTHKTTHKNVG